MTRGMQARELHDCSHHDCLPATAARPARPTWRDAELFALLGGKQPQRRHGQFHFHALCRDGARVRGLRIARCRWTSTIGGSLTEPRILRPAFTVAINARNYLQSTHSQSIQNSFTQ